MATSPDHQPINHLIIQPHLVRDLIGLDEDRLGIRSGCVGGVLEEVGERRVVQVEVGKTDEDPTYYAVAAHCAQSAR
jgi:hypothetical protein